MRLNEIKNINIPQIKVCKISLRTKKEQTLIIKHLNTDDCEKQAYNCIRKIIDKFIADDSANFKVKLIHKSPLIFNIISSTSDEYYRFSIHFPEDKQNSQKGLITAINKSFGAVVH